MNCDYQRQEDGTFVCQGCGDRKRVAARRNCGSPKKLSKTQEEVVLDALPEETRKLAGDYLADLISLFGVPPCGGCEQRKEWLNRVDAALRDWWSEKS